MGEITGVEGMGGRGDTEELKVKHVHWAVGNSRFVVGGTIRACAGQGHSCHGQELVGW